MSCTLVFIRHLLEQPRGHLPLKTISFFFDLLKKEVAVYPGGGGWYGTCLRSSQSDIHNVKTREELHCALFV